MLDLATITHAQFEACLNQRFRVDREEGDALEFELVQVQTRPGFDPRIHRRAAFSALFRGPIRPVLPQRIYRLTNETLGTLELFLVPIGPDADGMRYEAVFN